MRALSEAAALVPRPRVHLTALRWRVRPAQRPARGDHSSRARLGRVQRDAQTPEPKHRAMTWMQRLKRMFKID